jgi:hypothetical protein
MATCNHKNRVRFLTRIKLVRFLRGCWIPFACCALALVGCKAEDEIFKETITHKDREPIALRVAIMKRD